MANKKNKELKRLWETGKLGRKPKSTPEPPLEYAQMEELLDFLDEAIYEKGCDDTPRLTSQWLKNHGLPVEEILKWMKENGGYCDCEILSNVLNTYVE